MKTKKEPKYVAQTLAWCNARRKEKGRRALKKLPKGKRADSMSCPCGAASGTLVGSNEWSWTVTDIDRPLPKYVQRFVEAFDDGEFPQYEEKQ